MATTRKNIAKFVFAIVLAMTVGAAVAICTMFFPAGETSLTAMDVPDIKVYIRGEVNNSGLYTVNADLRLCELIDLAGGTTEKAELGMMNLAAILIDGTTVTIPAKADESTKEVSAKTVTVAQITEPAYIADEELYTVAAQPASEPEQKTQEEKPASKPGKISSGTININTAGKEDLMRLPGVGDATAGKIISYRESSGEFKSIEEIMNVSGIGEKKFDSMKQFIVVE